jgi:hypothetical protein
MDTKMNVIKTISLAAVLVLFFSHDATSQAKYNTTQGLGMGSTGTATVWGYQANFVNPANLAIPQRTKWSVGLFGGFSPTLGGELANIALYNEYFTDGGVLTPARNLEAANRWFGTGDDAYRELGVAIDVVPFGISHQRGNWGAALAIRSRTLIDVGMSRGVFLSTTGFNSANFGNFQPFDIGNEVLGFAEVSVGFALKVWESAPDNSAGTIRVFAGAAPKYLIPIHYHRFDLNSRLRVQDNPYQITHDFSYEIHALGRFAEDLSRFQRERQLTGQSPDVDGWFDNSFDDAGEIRGSGFGLDFGVTAEYYFDRFPVQLWVTRGVHRLRASLAVTDMGSINLDSSPIRFFNSGLFEWDGLDVDQDRLIDEFDSDLSEYFNNVVNDEIGNDLYLNLQSEELGTLSVDLPGMINFGLAYDLGKFTFALDAGRGFNNRGLNSENLYVGLGTEFRLIRALPLRVGMRTGGGSSTAYTFGTGLNFKNFEFTFSAMSVANSESNGSKLSAALSGFVIRF